MTEEELLVKKTRQEDITRCAAGLSDVTAWCFSYDILINVAPGPSDKSRFVMS